jgi:hypothetical protein
MNKIYLAQFFFQNISSHPMVCLSAFHFLGATPFAILLPAGLSTLTFATYYVKEQTMHVKMF